MKLIENMKKVVGNFRKRNPGVFGGNRVFPVDEIVVATSDFSRVDDS